MYTISQAAHVLNESWYYLCIKVDIFVICGIASMLFPEDDPLRIETCRKVHCDIIIEIYKEQFCAFFLIQCRGMVISNARIEQCEKLLHVTEYILLSTQKNSFRTDSDVTGKARLVDA